jgi:hypothetical protein
MTEGVNPDEVRRWLDDLARRDAEIQASLKPLLQEQAANHERQRLLVELLASFNGSASTQLTSENRRRTGESVGERVRKNVRVLLEEVPSGTLHINDIHAEFVKRGFEIPGAGRPANITAHLTRDAEIVSPQRGVYGLREVVGPVRTKPIRRRKATKRRK